MDEPIKENDSSSQLSDRARRAEKILAKPNEHKICEGCDSIVTSRVAMCPNCYSYRFNDAAEAVIAPSHSVSHPRADHRHRPGLGVKEIVASPELAPVPRLELGNEEISLLTSK
jgi:hypothetical protein